MNSLPAIDRDLPIIEYQGKLWTPNEILRQIESNPEDPVSKALQSMLEKRMFGASGNAWKIAKTRLIELIQKQPTVWYLYSIEKPILTAEERKREIMEETPFGRKLIELELRRLQRQVMKF